MMLPNYRTTTEPGTKESGCVASMEIRIFKLQKPETKMSENFDLETGIQFDVKNVSKRLTSNQKIMLIT